MWISLSIEEKFALSATVDSGAWGRRTPTRFAQCVHRANLALLQFIRVRRVAYSLI
ncbi:MAG: hypothetical protein R3Y58_04975 [Eubacteriales bacterium]